MVEGPLLVKAKGEFVLTPRAEALIAPVRRILADIERTFEDDRSFDPAAAVQTFRVAGSDAFEFALLPRLLEYLAAAAPSVRIELVPRGTELPEASLGSGEIDLACGQFSRIAGHLHARVLYDDPLVCVVRRDHPQIKKTLSLKQYQEARHVVTNFGAEAFAEIRRVHGVKLEIAMTVSHFLVAPMVVGRTDYVLTVPRWLADAYARVLPLRILKAPFADRVKMHAVWHERTHVDPANRWLRDSIAKLCARPRWYRHNPIE